MITAAKNSGALLIRSDINSQAKPSFGLVKLAQKSQYIRRDPHGVLFCISGRSHSTQIFPTGKNSLNFGEPLCKL